MTVPARMRLPAAATRTVLNFCSFFCFSFCIHRETP